MRSSTRLMPLGLSLTLIALGALHTSSGDALVSRLDPACPAARAGLQAGDVLIDGDRIAITHAHQLRYVIARALESGRRWIQVRVRRGDDELVLRLPAVQAGVETIPDDPPDRLQRAVLGYPRHRDLQRLQRAVRGAIDVAPAVGERFLVGAVEAEVVARDPGQGRLLFGLGHALTTQLAPLIDELPAGPRRERLTLEAQRLRRRTGLFASWSGDQRRQYVYAMRFQKAGLNFYLGKRLEPIVPNWRKAAELYKALGDVDNQLVVQANLALLFLRHGRAAAARRELAPAWRLVEARRLTLERARIARLQAIAALLTGDAAAARRWLTDGLSVTRRLDQRLRRLQLLETLAETELADRRPDRALAAYAEALASRPEGGTAARLELARGRLHDRLGQTEAALARYDAACERLEQLGDPPDGLREQVETARLAALVARARWSAAARAVARAPVGWRAGHRLSAHLWEARATRCPDRREGLPAALRGAGHRLIADGPIDAIAQLVRILDR